MSKKFDDVLENLQIEEMLEYKKGECEKCNTKKNLTIHHKKKRVEHPELIATEDNLMTLCERCHHRIHQNETN